LSDGAEIVIDRDLTKKTLLLTSSEMYDDLITAYRTGGYKPNEIRSMLLDLRAIPHEVVPTTLNIAIIAMDHYIEYSGSRRLGLFMWRQHQR